MTEGSDTSSFEGSRTKGLTKDDQRKSRYELRSLITNVNKGKKQTIKRNPRFRFRAAVRTVMNNLKWLTEESNVDEKLSSKYPKLSIQSKGLLRIPVDERSPEEKEMLSKLMGHLQCFDRYPEKVRDGLSTSATFTYFPPGRVLVREGHPSVAMYFIISGQANVSKLTFDPGVKKLKSVDINVMNAGDAFGEINILHDEPWPTTVTTLTHVEILTVAKENFQDILEVFFGEQQREITKCLNQFPYFKDWNNRTIVECCILARVNEYPNSVLIQGDNCGNVENACFIISGSCQVIYQLEIEHVPRKNYHDLRIIESDTVAVDDSFPTSDTVKGVERPKLKKIGNPFVTALIVDKLLRQIVYDLPVYETKKPVQTDEQLILVESHFFQIASLQAGACFGIGESLERKFILSSSHPAVLLCIPKFFLKFHNTGNIWGRLREFFNHTYPTPHTIFNQFIMDRRWKASREKYLESIIKVERPFTGLTSAEAPYYTRLTQDLGNRIFRRINKVPAKTDEKEN